VRGEARAETRCLLPHGHHERGAVAACGPIAATRRLQSGAQFTTLSPAEQPRPRIKVPAVSVGARSAPNLLRRLWLRCGAAPVGRLVQVPPNAAEQAPRTPLDPLLLRLAERQLRRRDVCVKARPTRGPPMICSGRTPSARSLVLVRSGVRVSVIRAISTKRAPCPQLGARTSRWAARPGPAMTVSGTDGARLRELVRTMEH
jgi:hypothetical protein